MKADQVLKGNYNPQDYEASQTESDHHEILCGLQHRISTDSLKAYLEILEGFYTRHTYSDTSSQDTGIGAARRWVYQKFNQFSMQNENRLLPSYLEFDYLGGSCGDGLGWRNVLGVLPGSDIENHEIILIEAHMDSRCEVPCDVSCIAPGSEDNGSGTALVLELARVLSRYTFKNTIVFMLTIGEEEGLYGGQAMASYCKAQSLPLKAVLNNDIVGAIVCGKTASPPGCPYEGHLDSTHVRLYSHGSIALSNRSLARSIKLFNDEKLKPIMAIPMEIEIMSVEDRTGRGGDHIPFRMEGFTSVRFTSANEHGDAAPGPGYTDRQHTSGDSLGVDLNADGTLDEFYVNFEYLKRNAIINGASLVLLALGPEVPEYTVHDESTGLRVEITSTGNHNYYRIGVRNDNQSHDFSAIYLSSSKSFVVPGLEAGETYFISVAGVNSSGITSMFGPEQFKTNDANTDSAQMDPLNFSIDCSTVGIPLRPLKSGLKVYPNPANDELFIKMDFEEIVLLRIYDLHGNLLRESQVNGEGRLQELQLTDGVYVYVVQSASGNQYTGKLIILRN
jgi:hypothetical protein